ncbi:conjugal transfer protein TraD [Chryseobacterium gleum]|uniref:conjugal transfer protein TraD n=1 Tax=Chryseobacterium gleum TaxID=250 RepID=UPI0028A81DB4|nr:conjugal transfer protein TraD [Chryseobacterium gleum]
MDILIIIGLIVIILLLLQDKIVIKRPPPSIEKQKNSDTPYPIMGETKTSLSHAVTTASPEEQKEEPLFDPFTLEIEYDISENVHIQNPQEEPEYGLNSSLNFIEEEEEWKKYRIIGEDGSFAQGATFEELNAVKTILEREVCNRSEREMETAAATVHKIYGTELYILLENSMENASDTITALLNNSFNSAEAPGSSTLRTENLKDFNIENFT